MNDVAVPGIVAVMENGVIGELREAAEAVAALDARRGELVAVRDGLIARAREAGVSWARIGEVTGLSVRGIAKALNRVSAGSGGD